METRVQKWGNSLGIRIPQALAKDVGIANGEVVELTVKERCIVVHKSRKYYLDVLLANVTQDNLHKEISTGTRRGREIW